MRTFCELHMQGKLRSLRPQLLLMLLGLAVAGCGGSSSDGGGTTTPPPPPPPPPTLPPISTTVVSLEDGHQEGATHWPNGNTSTGGQGQDIGTMRCLASQSIAFHVHTHLSIFLNGEALALPARVGFVDGIANPCHYPLHTHDATGMIHVHATTPTTFTLGQFFSIWGQTLSSTNVADLTGMPVVVYVTDNGVVTQNTGDWSLIELTSHREITIQVGTAITEIPNFTWVGP
jgi:hypothetical protein